jgi:putative Ca2+/H+ antiporter (TMEM165/GDT1 family)
MLQAYVQAMLMILIAEMGDKTQILAMAFATKYKVKQIILGVAIGAFLNHGLAIVLGSMLTRFVPIDMLQLIAGFMFVGFAFWSLKVDDDEEESTDAKYGPVLTVALAFFIGELGDKTQLTALTLGASSAFPMFILLGTVTGMVITSGLGIFIGAKLGHKIPEMQLKLGAYGVFMFFGLEKLLRSPYTAQIAQIYTILALLVIVSFSYFKIKSFVNEIKIVQNTRLQKQAQALFDHVHQLKNDADALCLGEAICESCKGSACVIGYMKALLDKAAKGEMIAEGEVTQINKLIERSVDLSLAQSMLMNLNAYYKSYPESYLNDMMLKQIRQVLNALYLARYLMTIKVTVHMNKHCVVKTMFLN